MPSTGGRILPPDPPHLRAPMKGSWHAIRKDKSLFVFPALAWLEQPVAVTKGGCALFPKTPADHTPTSRFGIEKQEADLLFRLSGRLRRQGTPEFFCLEKQRLVSAPHISKGIRGRGRRQQPHCLFSRIQYSEVDCSAHRRFHSQLSQLRRTLEDWIRLLVLLAQAWPSVA